MFVLSSSDLGLDFEEKFDLVQSIFAMQIFEFPKSLNLVIGQ